jgi:hypothetical protein
VVRSITAASLPGWTRSTRLATGHRRPCRSCIRAKGAVFAHRFDRPLSTEIDAEANTRPAGPAACCASDAAGSTDRRSIGQPGPPECPIRRASAHFAPIRFPRQRPRGPHPRYRSGADSPSSSRLIRGRSPILTSAVCSELSPAFPLHRPPADGDRPRAPRDRYGPNARICRGSAVAAFSAASVLS